MDRTDTIAPLHHDEFECPAGLNRQRGIRLGIISESGESSDSAVYDAGVAPFVKVLQAHGIETYESCEGGPGHSFPEPTVRFHGTHPQGLLAVYVALTFGPLPVSELRRVWHVSDDELDGPIWEMTFYRKATPDDEARKNDC